MDLSKLSLVMLLTTVAARIPAVPPATYADGRPQAQLRLDAKDQGVVLKYDDGPFECDIRGAREASVFEHDHVYYLHYDGAGPKGWVACLATSTDLMHWEKKGPVLELGAKGTMDAASASSPWVYHDGSWRHMFYVATPKATPAPDFIPAMPYFTLKARSKSPGGPWEKQYDVVPFTTKSNTYYSVTASPGQVVEHRHQYLMFFSAATASPEVKRTLSIARTKNLNGSWTVQPEPIVPLTEQIENSSLYYEPKTRTWFLFTNHIGINDRKEEFTDAIWVYWSKDLERWDPQNKAVVLDGNNCVWSKNCIGMPSIVKVGQRLAVLYDAPGSNSQSHMHRDIGLAWLELPLVTPAN